MDTVAQVAAAMQRVLTQVAERAGVESGMIRRRRKLSGASFIQALVFGWLADGRASLGSLNQAAAAVGVAISPQGLDRRFTPQAAECLRRVLEAMIQEVIRVEPVGIPLLRRFAGVCLLDSSTLGLPAELLAVWPGCGDSRGATAALKLQVRWNFLDGALEQVQLQAGREHDHSSSLQGSRLPSGALRIADLGYFDLDVLQQYHTQGVFWLSRYKIGTVLYDDQGEMLDLQAQLRRHKPDQVEWQVQLGSGHRLPCRLLAVRVPAQVAADRRRRLKRQAQKRGQRLSQTRLALAHWTLLISNAPPQALTLQEALVLARTRWQMEMLFKLWKSHGSLRPFSSRNPWRVLCEVYAKLIGLVMQHWMILIGCWRFPNRSWVKAAQTIQKHAFYLVSALPCRSRLTQALHTIQRCLTAGCRMNARRTAPNNYQLLLNPSLGGPS